MIESIYNFVSLISYKYKYLILDTYYTKKSQICKNRQNQWTEEYATTNHSSCKGKIQELFSIVKVFFFN
jgi:hypothetical protein